MKAINIKWDTDGEIIDLPKEIEIPEKVLLKSIDSEVISDYLSDEYGFCHFGFEITL